MLLQSAISQPPLHHHHHHHHHYHHYHHLPSLSSTSSRSTSLSFQFLSGFSNSTHQKTACAVFKGSPISKVHNYNTVDYEKKHGVKWKEVFQRVYKVDIDGGGKGIDAVLNEWEDDGNYIEKWEISKILRELRKRKYYKHALEVFEWMGSQEDRFFLNTSDAAVHLDLIAKVRGISDAEDFFSQLPDTLKDERVYGALLNGYVRAKEREKAESLKAQMKELGCCNGTLSYNVMMTLYMSLKEFNKVESVVAEMMANNIQLDLYTYNIWITSLGSQGSVEKMEQVIDLMNRDRTVNPNWSSFTTRATMYIKLGLLEKAELSLKVAESRLTSHNRLPYHYIISLYGLMGSKEEVKRVWNIYKTVFPFIPNLGFYIVISALTKLGEIEEAEEIYDEWLSVKTNFDARICNRLLLWYLYNGHLDKAEDLFDDIGAHGGKPMASSWEILATVHIARGRASEAVSCLRKAVTASRSVQWKPRPVNVSDILELCEKEGDMATKESLLGLLKQLGCFEDERYISCIPRLNAGKNTPIADGRTNEYDDGDDGDELFLSQLEAS